jgi:hypothetical protein
MQCFVIGYVFQDSVCGQHDPESEGTTLLWHIRTVHTKCHGVTSWKLQAFSSISVRVISHTEETFCKWIFFALQATVLYLVPPLIQFIGSNPEVKSSHLEYLHTVSNGAAPIGPNDVERLLKKSPHIKFTQGTLCQLLNTFNVL